MFIVLVIAGVFIGMPYLNSTLLENETEFFLQNKSKVKSISFNSKNFSKLPFVVKKYLRKSISLGASFPQYCHYSVSGRIRESKHSDWMDVTSQNYYLSSASDFIKISEIKNYFPLWTVTVDKYLNNRASTNSKLLASIPTYDFAGVKLSRSYLVLYLLESVFCPTVLMPNMNISWKAIDNSKALATIWDDDIEGSAVFHFNKYGEVVKIVTEDRYMPGPIDYNRETFTIQFANYKDVGNYKIPTYFEYQWNLDDGDFTFGRFQISEITYK